MFVRGVQKKGGLGSSPRREKNMSFLFKCLKWPILTEMTALYEIYLYIFLLTKGGYPPCGAEDPLRAETLHNDWTNVALAQLLVRRRASTWRWWTGIVPT